MVFTIEATRERTAAVHRVATWLVVMAVMCAGCRTPAYYKGLKSSTGNPCQTYCDHSHRPGRPCASCRELGCFGFEPTCWSRWPADCPSHCAVQDLVGAGPEVLLHQEVISDGAYPEDPGWELPANEVEPAPGNPENSESYGLPHRPDSMDGSRTSHRRLRADRLTKESGETASRRPLDKESSERSWVGQTDGLWWTDLEVQNSLSSTGPTSARRVPPREAVPSPGTVEPRGADTPVSSRRRAYLKRSRKTPEIARTAAVALPEEFDRLAAVRTTERERFASGDQAPVSSYRQPSPPYAPDAVSPLVVASDNLPRADLMTPARAKDAESAQPGDRGSTNAHIQRLPEVENDDVVPPVSGRTGGVDKAAIRFAETKSRTPPGLEGEESTASTVRFR